MIATLALSFVLASPPPEPKIHFVATVTDLRSIVEAVGGDRVEGIHLCAGRQDPHFVDPKPTYLVRMRHADLFVLQGLDLEIGWVPPLLEGARNPKILRGRPGYLDASATIPTIEVPPPGTTRAEGDVHPYGNPHYLVDPLNGLLVARAAAAKLKDLDPEGASEYGGRLADFERRIAESLFGVDLVKLVGEEKLERLARQGELFSFLESSQAEGAPFLLKLGGWLGRAAPLRGRKVVAYHKTLSYFAQRFGLDVVGYVEPKPGIPPSAQHVEELIQTMKREKVCWVLSHPFYDNGMAKLVADRAGARLVVLPSAVEGVPEAKDYFSLFDSILERLLGGKE